MRRTKMFAVYVLVVTPAGIPLVKDNDPKKQPSLWKLPGGRSGYTPPLFMPRLEKTAREKVQNKTGISLEKSTLHLLRQDDRGTHLFFFFTAEFSGVPYLKMCENGGGEIRFFSPQGICEAMERGDILSAHSELIQKALTSTSTTPPK